MVLAVSGIVGAGAVTASIDPPPPPPPGALPDGTVDESKLPAELPLMGRDGKPVVDKVSGKPVMVGTGPDALPPIEQFYDAEMKGVHPEWVGYLPAVTEPDGKGGRKVRPADKKQKPEKRVKNEDGSETVTTQVPD